MAEPAHWKAECRPVNPSGVPLASKIPDFLNATPSDAILYESFYERGMLRVNLFLPCAGSLANSCEYSLDIYLDSGRCIGYEVYELL